MYAGKKLGTLKPTGNVIFGTYDQVLNIINEIEDIDTYKLVVDEYHTLTRDTFRDTTMRNLIESFEHFDSVTLLTATPDKYIQDTLQKVYKKNWKISEIVYDWDNYKNVTVVETNNVTTSLVELINKTKLQEFVPNLYIMLNNVDMCNSLVKRCRLNEDEYHLICSKSRENITNRSDIADVNKDLRKVNFITSAGFEGCDIHDPNGIILTVVDVDKNTCMFDWQTIVQMQGRCRNSMYSPQILYHSSGKLRKDQTEEIRLQQEEIRMYHKRLRMMSMEEIESNKHVMVLNNVPVINPFSVAQVQRRSEVLTSMITLKDFVKYLKAAEYTVNVQKINKDKTKRCQTQSFRKQVEAYCAGQTTNIHDMTLIESFVETYGEERALNMICEQKYSKKQVERLILSMDKNIQEKTHTLLGICPASFYTNESLVKRIEFVNAELKTDYSTRYPGQTLAELGYRVVKSKINKKNGYYIISTDTEIHSTELKPYKEVSSIEWKMVTVSVACDRAGAKFNWYKKDTLSGIIFESDTVVDKKKQWYFSDGYNTDEYRYGRTQDNFNAADCMVLDIDGGCTIDEMNEFIDSYYGNAYHYIYETYSSTAEHPKFRVILPLTSSLHFYDEDYVRAFKHVKCQMFPDWQDPNCQLGYFACYTKIQTYGDP